MLNNNPFGIKVKYNFSVYENNNFILHIKQPNSVYYSRRKLLPSNKYGFYLIKLPKFVFL